MARVGAGSAPPLGPSLRPRLGALTLSLALAAALAPRPLEAAPRLTAPLVDQLIAAEAALQRALATLAERPTRPALKAARAAMDHIEQGLDAFFHAPNLMSARSEAQALRPVVRRLRAEGGLLLLVDDVLHFRPEVHARLAAAHAALGDAPGALRHHLALVAIDPAPAHLEAAARAADAAQDAAAAAALRARLATP